MGNEPKKVRIRRFKKGDIVKLTTPTNYMETVYKDAIGTVIEQVPKTFEVKVEYLLHGKTVLSIEYLNLTKIK